MLIMEILAIKGIFHAIRLVIMARVTNTSGSQPIADLYKLHSIEERDHPGCQDQPGAVAPPLFRLYLIQKRTIQAGEDSVHHCGDGGHHCDDTQGKLCNICKKVGRIKGINVGHQRKAEITYTEEPF